MEGKVIDRLDYKLKEEGRWAQIKTGCCRGRSTAASVLSFDEEDTKKGLRAEATHNKQDRSGDL